MEVLVMDNNLQVIGVIDQYESLLWTDRYNSAGDFEIYTQVNPKILDLAKVDRYLWRKGSEHMMIIESITIKVDVEDGEYVTIKGRSLESLLTRRIVWGLRIISGNVQNAIETLLNENLINPKMTTRVMPNFRFKRTDDPAVTSLSMGEAQFLGEDLYEAITKIIEVFNIGFKITLAEDDCFEFELYSGKDRSYEQLALPYVIFSPKFENLINSDFKTDYTNYKTTTLVAGEGEDEEERTVIVGDEVLGYDRREVYTDAKDINLVNDNVTRTEAEYTQLLLERGKESLKEQKPDSEFEGSAEVNKIFKYGVDFFLGDVVQVADSYGNDARSRVVEVVTTQDTSGFNVYPNFKIEDKEDK